jgi:hypothetical protein
MQANSVELAKEEIYFYVERTSFNHILNCEKQ